MEDSTWGDKYFISCIIVGIISCKQTESATEQQVVPFCHEGMLLAFVHLCQHTEAAVLREVRQRTCSQKSHITGVLVLKVKKVPMRQGGLTQQLRNDGWPFGLWEVNAQEVDGNARQRDGNAYQRVYGVAVERNRHQENGTHAEHQRVHQRQLQQAKDARVKKPQTGHFHAFTCGGNIL